MKGPIEKHGLRILTWIVTLSVIAIISTPLLPWMSISEEMNDSNGDDVIVTQHFNERYIDFWAENTANDFKGDLEDMDRDINLSTAFLWVCLSFALLGFVGYLLHLREGVFQIIGHLILIVSNLFLLFALLALLFNILFILDMGDFSDGYVDQYGDADVSFSYNYVPLIVSSVMSIGGILYIFAVLIPSIKGLITGLKKPETTEVSIEPNMSQ